MDLPVVEGGFILIARKLFENELMEKPHLYFKLWAWMLFKANFKDHGKLKRGQFLTSIDEMREAMSYRVGYRKEKPTRDEIRNCYEAFMRAAMITKAKTTRGMVITISNYEKYQNPKNYELHDEDTAKPPVSPHYKGMNEKKGKINISNFDSFYRAYPKHEAKQEAIKAWIKINPENGLRELINKAIEKQKAFKADQEKRGKFVPDWPLPATWLNGKRWEDEIPEEKKTLW